MIELDQYQLSAIDRLRNGMVLCGGTGSGKSRTSIAYYYKKVCGGDFPYYYEGDYTKVYGEWKDFTNYRKLYIITTAQKRDKFEWMDECADFNILPDDVVIDSWNNIKKYVNTIGAFFIFDEQKLTGSGVWVKSFYQIAKKNQWILLTATPGDSWIEYVPLFVANGFYKNRTEFCNKHAIFSRYSKYPQIIGYYNTGVLSYYKNLILIKMNYVKHTERVEKYIYCEYDKELYSIVWKDRWNPFDNCPIEHRSGVTPLLMKIVGSHQSRKDAVKKEIEKHPRMIIFYSYDFELDILREIGKEMGIYVAEWNGHKHMPVPNYSSWLYLVNYRAGAEGWNCIDTDTILFFTDNYSYKQMEQSKGRIDRRNTNFKKLNYIHLTTTSKIEVRIRQCLSEKEDFNEDDFVKDW